MCGSSPRNFLGEEANFFIEELIAYTNKESRFAPILFSVIGEHVNFSWNKKSCKFYSKQLGEYPYHTSYTIKGLPLAGLLDQWVGLRKVFVRTMPCRKIGQKQKARMAV